MIWKYNNKRIEEYMNYDLFLDAINNSHTKAQEYISKNNISSEINIQFISLDELYLFEKNIEGVANNISKEKIYIDRFEKNCIPGKGSGIYSPIIYISLLNILDDKIRENNKYLYFPKAIDFINSSIWFTYIPYHTSDNISFESRLNSAIIDIIENYNYKLYSAYVACEFYDLQIRLFTNSYLEDVKENISSTPGPGHNKFVVPFTFHSKTKIKCLYNDKYNKLKMALSTLKWKVLLVDDYGEEKLHCINNTLGYNKKNILEYIVKKQFGSVDFLDIETIPKKDGIKKAIDELKDKPYDIILLDYLLGEKGNSREYGHMFLDELLDSRNEIERIPLDKFWIINISSFWGAFESDLRAKGRFLNEETWTIYSGGDFINTPELFLYSLIELIRIQIRSVFFNKEDIIEFLKSNNVNNGEEIKGNIQLWAKAIYGAFMYKFGKREILELDKIKKSEFAINAMKHINNNSKTEDIIYYDNIRRFLFHLAYGTIQNSVQILELFYRIKRETNDNGMNPFFENISGHLEKNLII